MVEQQRRLPKGISIRRAAVLTACLAAIGLLAVVYWASELRLPDPARADRSGLFRWLATRDLRAESSETRRILLNRLREEIRGDFDAVALQTQIDERYRQRIWSNTLVLVETWYQEKVDAYIATPATARNVWLDETIDELNDWKELGSLQPAGDSAEYGGNSGLIRQLHSQVEVLKEAADEQRRKHITQFDAALRMRMMLRALGLTAASAI